MFIWKNIFKYIKLFLVNPITEIIINIIYLTCLVVIGILLFKENSNYDEHQILDITQSYLNFNTFQNIKTPTQFNSYLSIILDKLFTINPTTETIPLFIPINPIHFIYFNNLNECNTAISYNKNCMTESNKFKCVIDNLIESYKYECGKSYSERKMIFKRNLQGHYSEYNIRDTDNYIDITMDTYSEYQTKIDEIIQNKSLKAIIMQINLKAPSNQNYIDVILGVEMTNYFTDVKTIFSVNTIYDNNSKTKIILFVFIIFLSITVAINGLKFIYEINAKPVLIIHSFFFFAEVFDFIFMIICFLYISEEKNINFDINLEKYESHLKLINIIWYIKSFYSLLIIFFPFRLFSLLSWFKSIFEPFTIYINVIFKMGPSILLSFIFFMLMIVMFIFINYFLFNDIFSYYETIFKSFISTFDFRIIMNLYNRNPPSRIFGNLFQSHYSISFIFFQTIFFYSFSSIIIATLVYAFKKVIYMQTSPEEKKYMEKLEEIESKLNENKIEEYKNVDLMKKHLLWWTLDDKNSIKNDIISKYDALIFKSLNQILAFLKYIFAIKPEIQFKKLKYKLNIIIEINKKKIPEKEIVQIMNLGQWLIFVGSKIPIIIYSKFKFDNTFVMRLTNIYKLSYFINDDNVFHKILEEKGLKILSICKNENITFIS